MCIILVYMFANLLNLYTYIIYDIILYVYINNMSDVHAFMYTRYKAMVVN